MICVRHLFTYIAEVQRTDYLELLGMSPELISHVVFSCSLFDDVMSLIYSLYQKDFKDFERVSFCVRFSGKKAIDTGGVARDMFSAFFDECYM